MQDQNTSFKRDVKSILSEAIDFFSGKDLPTEDQFQDFILLQIPNEKINHLAFLEREKFQMVYKEFLDSIS